MELLASIAIAGTALLGVFIAFCIVVTLWKRGFGDSAEILLEQVLRRQGQRVAYLALASGDRAFAHAVRQCARCGEAPQCRAWLYSGAREGYQSFCPNAGFVQRMKVLGT